LSEGVEEVEEEKKEERFNFFDKSIAYYITPLIDSK